MAEARPELVALADELGIEAGHRSALDQRWVPTPDSTREALVAALGWAGASEEAAARSRAELEDRRRSAPASSAPAIGRCFQVEEVLGSRRVFGLWTHLYTVRSSEDWGWGHLGDLRQIVLAAARLGAAFVGLNPLHALPNRAGGLCPYAPTSRRFRNPLYLEPERVPELGDDAADPALRERIQRLRAATHLDPAAIEDTLHQLLVPLHQRFLAAASEARRQAYARHRNEQGDALTRFAIFQALADDQEAATGDRDWRRWPADLRDPSSPAVRAFAARNERQVDFHAWLQFELDRQLAEVARTAREAGLSIGLYGDLALGSAPGGADTWSERGLFVQDVTLGAPPDAFSRAGQDWGAPPLDPHALVTPEGRSFQRGLLEANLRHMGALRIDHAFGLRRLFWIPSGASPAQGAYVRYPEAELLAALAAASRRGRAIVVAEDLGTAPPGFDETLRSAGLLSSRVLGFEKDDRGFRPAESYPPTCLATANTHDLPPMAAWLDDRDLALRRRAGQIPDDRALNELRDERIRDRQALAARLVAAGAADSAAELETDAVALSVAVTRFLMSSPAAIVGLALDDLGLEAEPLNLPGVAPDRHPSWTRRMSLDLQRLFASDAAQRILAAIPSTRRSGSSLRSPAPDATSDKLPR